MKINFDEVENIVYPNFKDGEGEWHMKAVTDGQHKCLLGMLPPGSSIGLHTHETNCEVIYVLRGSGKVLFDNELHPVTVGSCNYCPKGSGHSLINDGAEDLVFFAVIPEQ